MTPIEYRMARLMIRHMVQAIVRPQQPLGRYRVDFLLWPYQRHRFFHGLIVGCDGKAYHSTEAQHRRDWLRDGWLYRRGYRTIRFWGGQILEPVEACHARGDSHPIDVVQFYVNTFAEMPFNPNWYRTALRLDAG